METLVEVDGFWVVGVLTWIVIVVSMAHPQCAADRAGI